jgi:hypothetical protein
MIYSDAGTTKGEPVCGRNPEPKAKDLSSGEFKGEEDARTTGS